MRRCWGAVSCLLVALVCAAPASAAWSPAVTISNPSNAAGIPHVAVDPAGDAVVLWGINTGLEAAYRAVGGTWSGPVPIGGFGAGEAEVAISPTGEAVAVWRHAELPSKAGIEAAFRKPDGTWTTPLTISPPTEESIEPQVAIGPNGTAVATWVAYENNGHTRIQAAAGTATGGWGEPYKASPGGQNNGEPDVAIDSSNRASVLWRHGNGAEEHLEVGSRSAAGVWADPPAVVPGPALTFFEPQIGVDQAGNATIAWLSESGTISQVEVSSASAGGAFGGPHTISTPGNDSISLGLAVARTGAAAVTWIDRGTMNSTSVTEGSVAATPGAWTPPADLAPGTVATDEYPALAIDDSGEAIAAWGAAYGTARYAVEAGASLTDGGWSPSTTLSGAEQSDLPSVGSDAAGDALVAWAERAAPMGNYLIRVSERPAPPHAPPASGGGAERGTSPTVGTSAAGAFCKVPHLHAKRVKAARKLLGADRCQVKVKHRHTRLRRGKVAAQKPGPGRTVAAGTAVVITVSTGPRHPH